MVAQPLLSSQQLRAVSYIKIFSKRCAGRAAAAAIAIKDEPEMDAATVDAGRKFYRDAECGDCHGAKGLGDGPSAGDLKDDWGHRIKPGDLTTPLKRGSSVKAIYQTLITGLDGTPMPSYQEALSEEQLWVLALFISAMNTGANCPLNSNGNSCVASMCNVCTGHAVA